jgi:hypothetical protein
MVFLHRVSAEPRQRTHLTLSSGFAFLQSSPRLHLANALPGARRQRPLMGSCSLQHMQGSGVHCRGLASPATFRLQGLATLLAVFSPRTRADHVSCRQRSWDSALRSFLLSGGALTFPAGTDPHAVSSAVAPANESAGRPDRLRLLGFSPPGSPSPRRARLTLTEPDAPLGFHPFQGHPPDAWPALPRPLLSRAWPLQ